MVWEIIGNILIGAGILFIAFGVFGIFKANNFYSRILIASKVDTVGFITILLGVAINNGLSFFSLKTLLIILIVIITNPLITHSIARSAYFSGYNPEGRKKN